MKNLKIWMIGSLVLSLMILAGCQSQRLNYLEEDTVSGPAQVRQGTQINPREITVWGVFQDGSRRVMAVSQSEITVDTSRPGPQTVRVRLGILTRQEVSFQTEVMPLRSLTVASPPRNTLFRQGEEPDPAWPGLEIRGEWEGMGSDAIDLRLIEFTGFMPNQAGRQTIRASFQGLTATFDVDVRSMTSIRIAQAPTKDLYIQGEPLDLEGLRVVGVWEGFPEEQLNITPENITGFNPNSVGTQRVTITVNQRSANFNVEVLGLTSLDIVSFPTRLTYRLGEELDLSGLVINGNYAGSDRTRTREVVIPNDQLVVLQFNSMLVGANQRVIIGVRDIPQITTQFPVTITVE